MTEKRASKRTEEQVVAQAPIEVILGGTKYEIAPLVIRDSREWRKKAIALIAPLPQYTKVDTDSPEEFEKALSALLVAMPDKVIELFFDYAKDLNKEEIEGNATDAEMALAFQEVAKVAFPLAESPLKMMERLSQ